MCGRYSLFIPRGELEARFDATCEFEYRPTYNAAPGQHRPVVTGDDPDTVTTKRWGLVPSWRDDDGGGLVNARAETVAEKPAFREAYERRRCLVPADGFYEWVEDEAGDGKRPYRVARPDDEPFAMAGIWERWTPAVHQTGLGDFGGDGPGGPDPVETFAVVTTVPNETVAELHDRMAVVLDRDEEARWLAGEDVPLDPYDGELRAYPVSTAVNDPSNDAPRLVEPV